MRDRGTQHAESRDADDRDPQREFDVFHHILALGLLASLEYSLEDLRPSEQADQGTNDHHRDAPPQRPLVDDLGTRDRHYRAGRPDARDDVAGLDHDRREDHEA